MSDPQKKADEIDLNTYCQDLTPEEQQALIDDEWISNEDPTVPTEDTRNNTSVDDE